MLNGGAATGQDKEWAQYDGKNRPVGSCCWDCGDSIKKVRPGMTIEEVEAARSKDPKLDSDITQAVNASKEINEPARFTPGSSVTHQQTYDFVLFQDFAALTAAEYKSITNVDPTSLANKKPFQVKWAGPNSTAQNLYLLGLEGMSPDLIASVRKVRLRFTNGVSSQDVYLDPDHQLLEDQGRFVLDHAFGIFADQRPQNPLGQAPESAASLRKMVEKEETAADVQSEAADGIEDPDRDDWDEEPAERPVQPRRAAPGFGTGSVAQTPAKAKAASKGGGKKGQGKGKRVAAAAAVLPEKTTLPTEALPSPEEVSASGKSSSAKNPLLDPEMQVVASKLGGASKCLENLLPEIFLVHDPNTSRYALSAKLRGVASLKYCMCFT